jgi:long-chain acyl-CoA synthetase
VPAVAATPIEPRLAAAPASPPLPASPPSPVSPGTGSADTLGAIIYTSGSTGEPRGVMLTHANFLANARDIVSYLELTARDRAMCVLPFYYVYGLSVLHSHLLAGGTVVIDNRFTFPNVVLEAMQGHEVTGFAGVPSTFALLLHRSNLESTALPALRYVTQAGGHMPPTKVREWLERGPRAAFFVMYGATEAAARLTYVPPARLAEKPGSIGVPLPSVSITVVREDGSLAAAGESGELVAHGPNVAGGYWNNAAETAERFGPLGYRTGDLGYVDADGFLFLVGRKHDMIKVGAHRVGAKEIEDVLTEAPLVAEAAVVAAPHDLQGEVPIAFVTLKGEALPGGAVAGALGADASRERGADANGNEHERALQAYCAARLAPHKVPPRIIIETELPKLAGTGKIDKPTLRTRARSLS